MTPACPHVPARQCMEADTVPICPITVFETAQKVRLGKWSEMMPFVDRLPGVLEDQGGMVTGFGPAICVAAGMMDWLHRDPFDRLLAATARQDALPFIPADVILDGVINRIW